jgi:CHAD domain-containing protein
MTEEVISNPQKVVAVSSDKWGKGLSPSQPTYEVAQNILKTRLTTVWQWLPLAAEKSNENVEYVHQLRIATRRAVEALRVFVKLIPEKTYQDMRVRLRKIRLAADEARDWDILANLFSQGIADLDCVVGKKVLEQIKVRRQGAQQPIVDIYQELRAEKYYEWIDKLLEYVCSQRHRKSNRKFKGQAQRYLKTVLKKFFKAVDADLSNDEALHNLRIRTKKLRYTIEIVAIAFESAFRERLYPRMSLLQDFMGLVNDHVTTKELFRDWVLKSQDTEQRLFLEGFLFAETRALQELRQTFLAVWMPKEVARLRRQFRMYCGLP